jgi:hypothetical protein
MLDRVLERGLKFVMVVAIALASHVGAGNGRNIPLVPPDISVLLIS